MILGFKHPREKQNIRNQCELLLVAFARCYLKDMNSEKQLLCMQRGMQSGMQSRECLSKGKGLEKLGV